jgi:hypothetical protein
VDLSALSAILTVYPFDSKYAIPLSNRAGSLCGEAGEMMPIVAPDCNGCGLITFMISC